LPQIMNLLTMDKKAVGKCPRFVLLEKLGQVWCKDGQWAVEVPPDVIRQIVEKLSN